MGKEYKILLFKLDTRLAWVDKNNNTSFFEIQLLNVNNKKN